MLSKILLSIAISFWLLIFYYSLLTVCGLMFRVKKKILQKLVWVNTHLLIYLFLHTMKIKFCSKR